MKKCKCGCDGEVSEGKEFLPGHYAKWKAAKVQLKQAQEISTLKPIENDPIENDPIEMRVPRLLSKKWWQFWKRKQSKQPFPTKLLSDDKIRERQFITSKEILTDEQKFLRFFGNLKKWTENRPGRFTKWLAEKKNRQ